MQILLPNDCSILSSTHRAKNKAKPINKFHFNLKINKIENKSYPFVHFWRIFFVRFRENERVQFENIYTIEFLPI